MGIEAYGVYHKQQCIPFSNRDPIRLPIIDDWLHNHQAEKKIKECTRQALIYCIAAPYQLKNECNYC